MSIGSAISAKAVVAFVLDRVLPIVTGAVYFAWALIYAVF